MHAHLVVIYDQCRFKFVLEISTKNYEIFFFTLARKYFCAFLRPITTITITLTETTEDTIISGVLVASKCHIRFSVEMTVM